MAAYYIDGLNGNDTTGDGSIGTPWKTIGKAIAVPVVAGDKIYPKATATYSEEINEGAINGTASSPIVLEGYGATVGDNLRATVDGVGGAAGEEVINVGDFWAIRNIVAQNGADEGIKTGGACLVENCEVDNAADRGIEQAGGGGGWVVGCYVHDCGGMGIFFFDAGGAFACIAENNSIGIQNNVANYGYFYCIARGNTLTQIGINSNGQSEPIINCTVDGLGSGTVGIESGATLGVSQMINCIIVDCVVGAVVRVAGLSERNWAFNNCLFGNTDNYDPLGRTVSGEVLADPLFFDQAALDYGPDTGSPCIATGKDFVQSSWLTMTADPIDIGALQGLGGGANFAGAFLNWGVN